MWKEVRAMNQFIYESKGKAKIYDLLMKGQRSKVIHRAADPQRDLQPGIPKVVLILFVVYAILNLIGY